MSPLQVSQHCLERGVVLEKIWRTYVPPASVCRPPKNAGRALNDGNRPSIFCFFSGLVFVCGRTRFQLILPVDWLMVARNWPLTRSRKRALMEIGLRLSSQLICLQPFCFQIQRIIGVIFSLVVVGNGWVPLVEIGFTTLVITKQIHLFYKKRTYEKDILKQQKPPGFVETGSNATHVLIYGDATTV